MKTRLLATLLLAAVAPAFATEAPCATPAHRAFDFWIGTWDVARPDGTLAGRNRIEAVLGGCALHESWVGASGYSGHSYNVYDAARNLWHQTWVDSTGTPLFLEGGLRDGRMVLQGEQASKDGKALHRITWTPLPGGQVRQHWELSKDAGRNWQTLFDGRYTRVKGAAPRPQ